MELDFCRLEVTILHSLYSLKTIKERNNNVADIMKYFQSAGNSDWTDLVDMAHENDPDMLIQLKFDNTQLNCELKVVDSTEDDSDYFQFKVWNIPENIVFYTDDYLLFRYYWDSDPKKYTEFHGLIKKVKSNRLSGDLETTIKGELVDQAILDSTSIFKKYPKLNYYSDVKDFVENELYLDFNSTIPGFSQKTKMPTPILTKGKSVSAIMSQVCQELTENNLKNADAAYPNDTAKWKLINGQTVLLYKDSDLISKNSNILNEQLQITVPAVHYGDLIEFTDNGDESYTVQCYGLPVVKAGISFYIDTTGAPTFVTAQSAYYTVDEVEHNITLSDGYTMKVYVRKNQ